MGYGCSGVSQLSTNYLGSKRHKNKQFAKADAFGVRNIVKRSNLPTNTTAALKPAPSQATTRLQPAMSKRSALMESNKSLGKSTAPTSL